jgi:DNA end-binding protein Ku
MSGHWSASEYRDNFHDAVMKLVEAKAKAGDSETVEPLEEAPRAQGADVIDLTELLRRSLRGGGKAEAAPAAKAPAKKAAASPSHTRATARKPATERAAAAGTPRKRPATAARRAPAKTSRARRAG